MTPLSHAGHRERYRHRGQTRRDRDETDDSHGALYWSRSDGNRQTSVRLHVRGDTLREFLTAFFDAYDVSDMLIAETEAEATTRGWATIDGDLPGNWHKNPEREQTRAYARVCVNGRFNELLDGLDTELTDDDRVALIYPFMYCV